MVYGGYHIRDIIWLSYQDYSGYRTGISGYFTRDIVVVIRVICRLSYKEYVVIMQEYT